MTIEQQVCSLELSKKLRELGVKQESLFIWVSTQNFGTKVFPADFSFDLELYGSVQRLASAFTVAELGEMLPPGIQSWRWLDEKSYFKWTIKQDANDILLEAMTEADARAKMLIYLVENKLITLNG